MCLEVGNHLLCKLGTALPLCVYPCMLGGRWQEGLVRSDSGYKYKSHGLFRFLYTHCLILVFFWSKSAAHIFPFYPWVSLNGFYGEISTPQL